jgi:cell shape-determining protein MreC
MQHNCIQSLKQVIADLQSKLLGKQALESENQRLKAELLQLRSQQSYQYQPPMVRQQYNG